MNREITVTMYLHAHPLALRYYTFNIANESTEFGNIHDPNIHNPNIHNPNIHEPNIHNQYMATLLSYTSHLISPQECQPLKTTITCINVATC